MASNTGFEFRQGEERFSSPQPPHRLWGPTSVLFNRYRGSFSGEDRPGFELTTHLQLVPLRCGKAQLHVYLSSALCLHTGPNLCAFQTTTVHLLYSLFLPCLWQAAAYLCLLDSFNRSIMKRPTVPVSHISTSTLSTSTGEHNGHQSFLPKHILYF